MYFFHVFTQSTSIYILHLSECSHRPTTTNHSVVVAGLLNRPSRLRDQGIHWEIDLLGWPVNFWFSLEIPVGDQSDDAEFPGFPRPRMQNFCSGKEPHLSVKQFTGVAHRRRDPQDSELLVLWLVLSTCRQVVVEASVNQYILTVLKYLFRKVFLSLF